MSALDIILSVLTAILGGGNLWQALTIRSFKRKSSAEADRAEIDNLKLIIQTQAEQMNSLQARYDKMVDKYDALMEKYDSQQEELRKLKDLITIKTI